MKNILVTGVNSFVGKSFETWMKKWPSQYQLDFVSLRNQDWQQINFSKYDCIFHVAGIAHVDIKENNVDMRELYYRINCDLAVSVATKAKKEGVKQFIFMSSVIVYGEYAPLGVSKMITHSTVPKPVNYYGDSKLKAENQLIQMKSPVFNIVIIRAPLIYGEDNKGNYRKLIKLITWFPVFPDLTNERSVLHIDNLCELVRKIIDFNEQGIFHPQDKNYIKTSDLVVDYAIRNGRKIILTKALNPLFLLFKNTKVVKKMFGNLTYDKDLTECQYEYQIYNLKT